MLCTSGFVDNVMFFYKNGPYGAWQWQYRRECRAEASSDKNFERIRTWCHTV